MSAVVFALFFLPQALARNIETVLVSRFISGCAGSTAVSLVGGTIADVWRADERGTPMAWFSFAAFGGERSLRSLSRPCPSTETDGAGASPRAATGLGPVMFGYLVQEKGFRAVNWVMFAMSAAFAVGLPLLLKETRASVLLSRKAAKLRKETGDARYMSRDDFERGSIRQMMKTSLGRPVRLLFTEPVLVAMTAWISFQWGVLCACLPSLCDAPGPFQALTAAARHSDLFLVSIPYVFGRIYEFNTGECGMIYVTQFIGSVIGMSMDQYCMRLYRANVAKRGPEARLYTAFVGGVCVPVGAFIFCFTAYPHVHWMAPTIGIVILCAFPSTPPSLSASSTPRADPGSLSRLRYVYRVLERVQLPRRGLHAVRVVGLVGHVVRAQLRRRRLPSCVTLSQSRLAALCTRLTPVPSLDGRSLHDADVHGSRHPRRRRSDRRPRHPPLRHALCPVHLRRAPPCAVTLCAGAAAPGREGGGGGADEEQDGEPGGESRAEQGEERREGGGRRA